MAAAAGVWSLSHPGRPLEEAATQVLQGGPLGPAVAAYVLAGGLAGFLLLGLAVGNRLALRVLHAVGGALLMAAAGALGLLFGLGAYLLAWLMSNPGHGLGDALAHLQAAPANRRDPLGIFMLAGFLAGLVGTAVAAGRGAVRAGARVFAGALIGALAGLLIYSVAYVMVFYPVVPDRADYLLHIGQATYSGTPSEFLLVGLASACGALLSRYSWKLYGILTFVSLLFVVLGYVLYTLFQTLPGVPPQDAPFSLGLFAAELASLLMVLLYSFYTIDVAARKHWHRSTEEAAFSAYFLPKVAIHVPTFNEPPELVIDTLQRLQALDYPEDRFLIMVGDDSTEPESSRPLREFCLANGIEYIHRGDRRGYKAGALNALLRQTPSDANILAVVDADYQVEPEYLRETVGYFVDPDLGWLQTPQDYRNRDQSFLTEQYYLADAYFYRTILPSRNEENSIIFCGTMGMLRRRAVEEVGGWGEKYITEDAELSARLLNAGWKSLYVNKTFGRGLIPPTFEGYKRQHYRWAFGGGKILRGHFFRFLFGRYTFRQRLDYLVGTLNWFEGAFLFGIASMILFLGVADLAGSDVVTHHSSELLLVGLVPLFLLLDGLTRVHLVLRRSIHLTFGGTLRILGMWFSVKFSNMRAATKALLGFSIPFVRTPKAPGERMGRGASLAYAIRLTRFESTMAVLLLLTAIGQLAKLIVLASGPGALAAGRLFMVFWLMYYALVFTAAPLYAYKSFVTLQPETSVPVSQTPPKDVIA